MRGTLEVREDLVAGYTKKVDTTSLDLGPTVAGLTGFFRNPPTPTSFVGEATILVSASKPLGLDEYRHYSSWRVDGDKLHFGGGLRPTFYERLLPAAGGDVIRYRNKPMTKLTDTELAAFDGRVFQQGGIDL